MLQRLRNLKQRLKFYLEQDLGLKQPTDGFSMSKGSFKKYLPSNPVIVDCGSYNGADAIDLVRIFPEATVYCFEPVPELFIQLKGKTAAYPNIHCYQIALSDQDGEANMYVSSQGSDGSSSLLEPSTHLNDHPNVLFNNTIRVKVMKLDTWAQLNNIKSVDLLWLDMQGFEFQMLEASPNILHRTKLIHTEISMKDTYKGVIVYDRFKAWLEANSFFVIGEAIPHGSDMGNVLLLRKN